jgi:hypothetical protein
MCRIAGLTGRLEVRLIQKRVKNHPEEPPEIRGVQRTETSSQNDLRSVGGSSLPAAENLTHLRFPVDSRQIQRDWSTGGANTFGLS